MPVPREPAEPFVTEARFAPPEAGAAPEPESARPEGTGPDVEVEWPEVGVRGGSR